MYFTKSATINLWLVKIIYIWLVINSNAEENFWRAKEAMNHDYCMHNVLPSSYFARNFYDCYYYACKEIYVHSISCYPRTFCKLGTSNASLETASGLWVDWWLSASACDSLLALLAKTFCVPQKVKSQGIFRHIRSPDHRPGRGSLASNNP